jgi:hypothetical protein
MDLMDRFMDYKPRNKLLNLYLELFRLLVGFAVFVAGAMIVVLSIITPFYFFALVFVPEWVIDDTLTIYPHWAIRVAIPIIIIAIEYYIYALALWVRGKVKKITGD